MKLLITKQRSVVFFFLMILILLSTSNIGYGQDKGQAETINPPLSERTPQIRDAIVAAVPGVNAAADVTAAHLAAISRLDASKKSITALKSGDFSGLTALTNLYLYENAISDISALKDLTSLTRLYLYDNDISDISPLKNLTSLTRLELYSNSISDISALEDLTSLTHLWLFSNAISDISVLENLTSLKDLWLTGNSISNISALEDLTSLTFLDLAGNSITDTSPLEGLTNLTRLHLKGNPISDYGPVRRLKAAIEAAGSDIYIDVDIGNKPPVFTDGPSTTRTIAENTPSGQNIGTPIDATDVDGDTLTCTLSGTDAASFSIVNTNGQLRTRAALDFETKNSYSVTVDVSDGNGGSDSIPVTINITNVNEAPSFATTTASRSIAENTAANTNIGAPVTATDVDASDTLTYTLEGADAASFNIVSTNGQLKTKAALDHETKASYSVRVTATDGDNLSDTISVTISVTNVNEAPSFATTTATRSVAENTAANTNIGAPVTATDVDANTTLAYTLDGADAGSFSINSTNGQLRTSAALDYEKKTSYTVRITVSDSELTDTIDVTINVTNVDENRAPSFTDGSTATRSVAENTGSGQNIGSAVSATDPDDDTLAYKLSGTDAGSFSINSTNGQLRTSTALDYETKTSYTVRITVSDSELTDTVDVTINVTNVNEAPSFATTTATRSVAENTAANTNIGAPVTATDVDANTTLAYTLDGADAGSFSINSTNGQLRTSAALDYEAKSSYSVTIIVSDSELTDTIDVSINVTNVDENRAPSFAEGTSTTRSIAENTAANANIGSAVSATDPDDDTLTYTLSGADAASFSINSTNGQLRTSTALDYETKTSYTVRITVSDSELTDTIDVTINVTNVNEAPSFATTTATRSIAENTAANTDIGAPFTATDVDASDTLTYTLEGADAGSFSINSTNGQLRTSAALDYEAKSSYSVTIIVSDSELTDTIDVSINVTNVDENRAPSFAEGTSTTRSIAENTAANANIGSAVSATDPDDDTLTYTLSGADAASFSINSTNGQLRTSTALDYETKTSYTVRITVSDSELTDTIDVTINVTNVNEAPSFATTTATRSIAENTAANTDIGAPFTATDVDASDTLTYTLEGADSASFNIVSTTGQLKTKAALDFETTTSYSVRITVSDSKLTDTIDVTINVTNVNEAPNFATATASRSIAENTGANTDIGDPFTATDADANTTLAYTLEGRDAASFSIDSTNGQLRTSAPLDYETKLSYLVSVFVSDGNGGSDSIAVTINVTDVDETPANRAPTFTDGSSITRSIAENSNSGTDIGSAIAATDADDDTLTYTLDGTDAASFSINSTNGQLQTKAALDYETKTSYSVRITVSDSELTDTIDVTINVTNVNEAPSFATTTATRSIAENTAANTNIGDPFTATDVDSDTLTYSLDGTDASSFSIVSTSGQLRTNAALDYETKPSYSVSVSVSDGKGGNHAITVTINVTDANDAPVFTDIARRRIVLVPENRASGTNIGAPIAATDADSDTLTYSLSGADASSFSIVSTLGQLQAKAALDYETKTSYTVTITVSDSELTDTIDVTIDVGNVNEAPSFATTTATRSIAENTAANTNIGDPVTATDVDANTTLAYTLDGTDAGSFSINSTNGQLRTSAALDYEKKTSYTVRITVSDSELTDTIDVTINVTNVDENRPPSFTDGSTATRSVAENTGSGQNIGGAVSATDPDDNTLTYTLSGGDAGSFSINSTNGQLRTSAPLDYETKSSYLVAVFVSDGNGGRDGIAVTINVTDVDETPANRAPTFTDGSSITRSIAENSNSGTDIGSAIAATDADDDTLTYTLDGTDAGSFSINSTNGQLRTSAALDYEAKTSYSVRITVSDSELTDTIDVTISVTNVNEAPNFATTTATRSIAENTAANTNIGAPVTATDVDANTTLTYTLGGTDAASFSINSTTGQLKTNVALDYETKTSYSVRITVSDSELTDTIDVTINVTNVNEAPNFATTTATRSIVENTAANTDIGAPFTATDADTEDTLTYTLEGADAGSFSINSTNGQLKTKAALDFETATSYSVRITVSDSELTDTIDVTINVTNVNEAPSFATTTATRSVAENTTANTDIGSAITATDPDTGDTLTYTLGGTDKDSFSISGTTGQLRTNAALDFETKTSYTVRITVSDSELTDTIDVSINVSNVNEAPSFATTTATRTIAENKASTNIGTAVTATDVDANTTLTYTLSGTDAASFSIVSTNGRLRTRAALNYETKTSYTVRITVSDSELTDTIDVTIDVTDVYEPIIHRTQQVQDAIVAAVPGVNHADYVTVAHLAAITNLNLSDKSITSLKSGDFNELPALTNLNLWGNSISDISALAGLPALKYLYLWDNSISDISVLAGLTKLTKLNLSDNSISDISALAGLTALTELHLDGNSISNISALAGLTKLTNLNLSGNSISDISALAGLTALTNLNLSGTSISDISTLAGLTALEVLYLGGNSISDISALADLTGLTNLNLSDNSISNISVLAGLTGLTTLNLGGNPISNYDPLRRLLAAIDGIEDHQGLTLDINIPPVFTEGTDTTRAVAEYTPSDQDIGDPVSATDVDSYFFLYSLEGPDADAFSIDAYTGQLQTSAALDYRTKRSYSVTVSVSDGNGGTDSITVTINVTYVNRAPSFTDGSTTTRLVAENTASGQNIGTPVAATDADDDTLSYSLEGPDAASFRIVSASGQLRTRAALDYDTKSSYSVTVSVSDGYGGTDSIAVTINVTSVNEGSITPVNQRTQQVQDAIMDEVYEVDYDVDSADDVTPAHLAAITELDLSFREITSLKSGDFSGLTGLTTLRLNGNSISDISALKGLTTLTTLYLWGNSISDVSALKGLTTLTTLYLWGNSISDISTLAGLTALTDLYLSENSISNISALEGLTKLTRLDLRDNPISDYAPLRRLLAAIDAIEDHPGLTLDINIPPLFTEGTDTRRSVAEYTPSGENIGDPVSATDVDNDYLTYTLEGTDADTFSIDTSTGQLQTSAALNYRTKRSYSVTVSVSDGYDGTDSIAVRIYVTDVNEARITPVDQRTQEVQDAIMRAVGVDNAADVTYTDLAGINYLYLSAKGITSLKSGDFSGLPALTGLDLSDNSISNISALSGLTELTELNLFSNSISNISALRGLTKLTDLDLFSNSISNISVLRGLPALTELDLSDNSISNISALERLTGLTTLNLSGNSISNYEPLRKLLAAIDGIEGHPGLTLDINIPPVFTDGTYTTRAVAEYTLSEKHIGDPVSATDANKHDSLTYTLEDKDLEGTDAASFNIHSPTGQLLTLAPLNYRTKRSYSVTISVSDGNGGTDRITVRINVTDVDESRITPVNQRTQQVQDAIVSRVYKVDNADDVTVGHLAAIENLSLSYDEITSLKSGDFSGLTGLTTLTLTGNSISDISALADLTALENLYLSENLVSDISALEGITSLTEIYLSGNSISDVSALEGLTALTRLDLRGNPISDYAPLRRLETAIQNADNSISIDINITNNPPQFTDGGSTTRSIAENTEPYTDIGEPISATDADPSDNLALTYSFAPDRFGSSDARLFSIDNSNGQLRTSEDLDYEEQTSYTVIVDVSDFSDGLDRITVTINITDVAGAAPSVETSPIIPNKTALLTNFPNPFNPETWIPYQLAKPAEVTLTIYDIRGVVVRELKLGHQPAGVYHNRSRAIHWDGRNAFGEKVATGVYFYTLKAGDFTATRKLLIRK